MDNISKTLDEIKAISLDSMNLILEYAHEMIDKVSKKTKEEESILAELNDKIGKTSDHKESIKLHSKAINAENRIKKLEEASNQLSTIDVALTAIASSNSNVKSERLYALLEKYYGDLCVINTNVTNLGIRVKKDKTHKIDSKFEKLKTTSLTTIELILNSAQEMSGIVSDRLTEKEEKYRELKEKIAEKFSNGDYKKVRTLSGKIVKIEKKLIPELKTIEQKLSEIDKSLTAIVNDSSNFELSTILNNINKYYGELCEVNVLLGKPALKGNVVKKIDSKEKEALDALDVARRSLSNDDLNVAINLVNALPDGKSKDDMQKQVVEISNLIDNKTKFDETKNLVDEAEKNLVKNLWLDAETKVNALSEGTGKEELKTRIEKLYKDNDDKIVELLEGLEDEINNTQNVTMDKIKELYIRYDISVCSSFGKIKDKNLEERIKKVIKYGNSLTQEQKQKEEAINNPEKIGLKARLTEFFGFPVSAILKSKFYGKVLKKKIENAKKVNDNEAVEKYEKRNQERDIVSGVRLYKSLDTLSKLKTKLYSNNDLSKFDSARYNGVSNSVSNKLAVGLKRRLKKEYDLILNDKTRTINVANQYMQMLAVQDIKEDTGRFSKIKKILKIKTNQEKYDERVSDVIGFLDEAKDAGTLTPEEVLAYKEEIDNISFYKGMYKTCNSYNYVDSDVQDILNKDCKPLPYIKK